MQNDKELDDRVHDVRNLMCNIMSACSLIEMEEMGPESQVIQEMLTHIKTNADEVLVMIDKIAKYKRQR